MPRGLPKKSSLSRRLTYWRKFIGGFEGSGLSKQAYCDQRGVRVGSFDYWSARLRRLEGPGEEDLCEERPEDFIRLGLPSVSLPEESSPWRIKIGTRRGDQITLEGARRTEDVLALIQGILSGG